MFFGLFDFAGRRNRKLRQAAKQGDRFTVRELLAKGADPNERDPDGGDTALVLACFGNHHGAVEAMLLGKADPTMEQGDEELCELLERFGAEPSEDLDDEDDEQDEDSNEAGSDEEPTDLAGLLAKMQGALADATSALGRLSGSSLADKPAGDRLIIAASHSNVEQVTEILESGVDVNHLDSDGDTALGLCVLKVCTEELEPQRIRDFFELIDLLLEHGAQVDVPGCRVAPLPMVARSGSLALTNAFLRAGANPDAVMTDMDHDAGKTALEVAREGGHDEVVAALLAAQG